jgi:malate synthase
MGGMSAFIPSKDEEVNRIAFEKVRADKEREAKLGHDGTWVAHPKMVGIAKAEFDKVLGINLNQKNILLDGVVVTSVDLLNISSAGNKITEEGVRTNIRVALQYIESWLTGIGAVALYNLMEDAATAEISRAQLWQWLHHKNVFMDNGRLFDVSLYKQLEEEEMDELLDQFRDEGRDKQYLYNAEDILNKLVLGEAFEDFLTTTAYQKL